MVMRLLWPYLATASLLAHGDHVVFSEVLVDLDRVNDQIYGFQLIRGEPPC